MRHRFFSLPRAAFQSARAAFRSALASPLAASMSSSDASVRQRRYESVELQPLADDLGSARLGEDTFSSRLDDWLEYAARKLFALLWVVIAGGLAWYIRLLDVIVDGHVPGKPERQLARFYFNIGVTGFALWLCMAAYLIVWVKYIKKFPGEWEEYWPKAIPIAAVCAALSCLGFIIAMWPIWGFLSLPIMFFLLMGGIQSAHFIPL